MNSNKNRPIVPRSKKGVYREEKLLEGFLVELERLGYGATSISQHRQAVAEFLERESHEADKQAVERHYRYLLQRPNQRRVGA